MPAIFDFMFRELLEMRSRLYLNLGLVYQHNEDLQSAKKFIEKALSIVKYVSVCVNTFTYECVLVCAKH